MRSESSIKHSLSSFLAAGDQPTFLYIKYLIIFPDRHEDFWFSVSRSPKKEGAGKPTPSLIDRVSGLDALLREAGRVINVARPVSRYQRVAVIEAQLEQLQSVVSIAPEVVLHDVRE